MEAGSEKKREKGWNINQKKMHVAHCVEDFFITQAQLILLVFLCSVEADIDFGEYEVWIPKSEKFEFFLWKAPNVANKYPITLPCFAKDRYDIFFKLMWPVAQ